MHCKSGELLRATRTSKNLTLRDVAYLARYPNAYTFIGRIERDEVRTCSEEFATAVAAVLNVPRGLLFDEQRASRQTVRKPRTRSAA